jgi:toxin ParE1/3/4
MSFKVVWSQEALDQADALLEYIAQDSVTAATSMWERLQSATVPLAEHPYMFRPGREPGTRELVVHPNYILIHRVLIDTVEIVAVLHARREYP